MAPMLFHGLSRLGLPIVCVDSQQAYQALKSLATHKTDRNDARGLAHLARTGLLSLPAANQDEPYWVDAMTILLRASEFPNAMDEAWEVMLIALKADGLI
jgi:hypothetical protein